MIARSVPGPRRSGITLTEILIAILIMGIGLISLATLFPLGLIRLRDAARFHRGGMLVQSASDDLDARKLLDVQTFYQTWYGGTPANPNATPPTPAQGLNPPLSVFNTDATLGNFTGVSTYSTGVAKPGIPVCYDPLWRAVTNIVPLTNPVQPNSGPFNQGPQGFDWAKGYSNGSAEARFGCGIPVDGTGNTYNPFNLRLPSTDTTRSAYGLQRISNFVPWSPNNSTRNYQFTYTNPFFSASGTAQAPDVAGDTFPSVDDLVYNSADARSTKKNGSGQFSTYSSLLPDLDIPGGGGSPITDWRYSWFFTGRQVDSTNTSMFQGEIVVCDGRPFGFEPMVDSAGTVSPPVATGEQVIEAIFGFSTNVGNLNNAALANTGTSVGSDRSVLLRWPSSIPDPQVRIGGWIADVTYERDQTTSDGKVVLSAGSGLTYQRCYWYQVVKRTDGENETTNSTGPAQAGYRRMVLTVSSPVRAKTLCSSNGSSSPGQPVFLNVALVMPSVINVFPRSFIVH